MHDPCTQICQFPTYSFKQRMKKHWWIPRFLYNFTIFTLWHKDPEKDGSDDSCGWFKRAKHGNPEVLKKIIKNFEFDWDKTWTYDPDKEGGDPDEVKRGKTTYCRGLFNPNGIPRFSNYGVVLNLFLIASNEHFKSTGSTNWKRSKKFMRDNLMDILLFAENPSDSLYDSLNFTFGKSDKREERIREFANIIYGWIIRADQPWYRHARWHIHHWRFQIHLWQYLKRGLFDRCSKCGKRFKFGSTAMSDWHGTRIWHEDCNNRSARSPANNAGSQPVK